MNTFVNAQTKQDLGFTKNEEIPIKKINGLVIDKFRSFENQEVILGKNITILSGRNGSMKTSILGLIAHPFSSDSKDVFGKQLKTALSDVFKLSKKYDKEKYEYHIVLDTVIDGETKQLSIPVQIYMQNKRHRIVVTRGDKDSEANLSLNTSFLNLKRLFPLVDTEAELDIGEKIQLTSVEKKQLRDFYEKIFPSRGYAQFTAVHDTGLKTTFAPTGEHAKGDWDSISSGEDNLGAIFNRLIGFQRSYVEDALSDGIFCIDEFESSLHPVALISLFNYLYEWSQKYNVQIVISTHSLQLISYIYLEHKNNIDAARIVFNFISQAYAENDNFNILENPPYKTAYDELTLSNLQTLAEKKKIKVFCEDDYAKTFIRRLVRSSKILSQVVFYTSLNPESKKPGTPYPALAKICSAYPVLLEDEMSFVVFDADVDAPALAKIKNKDLYLQLPDPDGYAIEKRIMLFILELKNSDYFFQSLEREQSSFFQAFKKAGLEGIDADSIKDAPIDTCKKWANHEGAKFKHYITCYCRQMDADLRGQFVDNFIERVNSINQKRGVPISE